MAAADAGAPAAGAAREAAVDDEEWVGEEEAWSEDAPLGEEAAHEDEEGDNDEDEDELLLGPRALPVDGEPDFESGPPADGLEYLRRVRWEAAQAPAVTRAAAIDPRTFDSKRTSYAPRPADFAPAPPGTEASRAWVQAFQPEFAALRSSLRRAVEQARAAATVLHPTPPPFRDAAAWEVYCLGSLTQRARAEQQNQDADAPGADAVVVDDGPRAGHPPALGVLASMDEVEATTMLHRAIGWLEHAPSLSRQHALWLFALLARVDQPLDADTGAAARHLCRRLCALRASGCSDATGPEPADALVRLNLLLAAAGEFFGAAPGAAYT